MNSNIFSSWRSEKSRTTVEKIRLFIVHSFLSPSRRSRRTASCPWSSSGSPPSCSSTPRAPSYNCRRWRWQQRRSGHSLASFTRSATGPDSRACTYANASSTSSRGGEGRRPSSLRTAVSYYSLSARGLSEYLYIFSLFFHFFAKFVILDPGGEFVSDLECKNATTELPAQLQPWRTSRTGESCANRSSHILKVLEPPLQRCLKLQRVS